MCAPPRRAGYSLALPSDSHRAPSFYRNLFARLRSFDQFALVQLMSSFWVCIWYPFRCVWAACIKDALEACAHSPRTRTHTA
jgi:hypothetical protein